MAHTYPIELLNVHDGTEQGKADGRLRNAAQRIDRSTFNTTTAATTTADTLSLGKARAGQRTLGFRIAATTNMSAASIAIGTADDPDKYLAAAALPNATVAERWVGYAAEGYDPIEEDEELVITISEATIPNGFLTIDRMFTQR